MRHARQDLARTDSGVFVHKDTVGINVNRVWKSETVFEMYFFCPAVRSHLIGVRLHFIYNVIAKL